MEQLLQRYIRGKVSEEERLKVVSWLDESPDNMREFLALRKLYDISLWHTDTEQKTLHKKFIPTILGARVTMRLKIHYQTALRKLFFKGLKSR